MADSYKPSPGSPFAVNPHNAWYTYSPEEAARHWQTNLNTGLSTAEAQRWLAATGPNRLRKEKRESFWAEFVEELGEPMILLLLATGVIYALWGELGDALTIFLSFWP